MTCISLRRNIAGLIAATALLLSACSPQAPQSAEDRLAQTHAIVDAGGETLRGEVLDTQKNLVVFRGIPFAAPPTGGNRWQPPAPHAARPGVQNATRFGPACPQNSGNTDFYKFVAEQFGSSPDVVPAMKDISEDCLYLNVWTTNPGQTAKRPVMVWIYGGSNMNGYSHEPEYLGHNFARRGVIYVSLNYRVGVLGFMAHAGLSAESPNGVSGNYGILDQIAALQWVKNNIAAFGGDPDNITVFGESAGAADTATLIASPLAKGLFQRAISQSGGYPVDSFYTLAEAETMGSKIVPHFDPGSTASDAETIAALRELGWEAIVQGAADSQAGTYAEVNIDGWLLPESLAALYKKGKVNAVDLLIGANGNEDYPWIKDDPTNDDLNETLSSFGSPYDDELAALLLSDANPAIRRQMDRIESARDFLCPSLYIANAMANNQNPVYVYYFTRVRPNGDRMLAYHGAEISYTHDTAYDWLPADETDRALTNTVGQYWVNFATAGSPNGDGVPHWPPYTAEVGEYQDLGNAVSSSNQLETELCTILDRRRQSKMAQ